jgi:P27 family predicted phage terminase small subunit
MAATASNGRKAAPRNLRLLNGTAPGKDSGGRVVEPEVPFVRGPLIKPEVLSYDASWLWDLVIEQMETIGLLKPLDAASLEIACETFAMWRDAVRTRRTHGSLHKSPQGVLKAPWVTIEREFGSEFRSWCAEYGLTPAAESKLSSGAGDGKKDLLSNPFA